MKRTTCQKWLNDRCNQHQCRHWDWCELMNDNAIPEGMRKEDYHE